MLCVAANLGLHFEEIVLWSMHDTSASLALPDIALAYGLNSRTSASTIA